MTDVKLEIERAVVLINRAGADHVALYTQLPSPYPPEVDDAPLDLSFKVRKGRGVEYVQTTMPGLPIEVIDASNGKRTHL